MKRMKKEEDDDSDLRRRKIRTRLGFQISLEIYRASLWFLNGREEKEEDFHLQEKEENRDVTRGSGGEDRGANTSETGETAGLPVTFSSGGGAGGGGGRGGEGGGGDCVKRSSFCDLTMRKQWMVIVITVKDEEDIGKFKDYTPSSTDDATPPKTDTAPPPPKEEKASSTEDVQA
ncbi:hypothetical protein Bca52824_033241 [Brassica carinata]|uniref:Uncharacterized protein n=1 Tax=Brassica carinata TaxID=52824 RepID=A0A8X7V5W3_BRACI|nr:hypothetical protein Bca52824_033241 [Brassica carinata]